MSNYKWQKIRTGSNTMDDLINIRTFRHIDPDDNCFHLMEWIKGGSYKDSEANSRILNFKNPPKAQGSNLRYYKDKAIKQFAKDLYCPIESIIKKYQEESICVSFIPSSVSSSDGEYDDRFEKICALLCKKFSKIHCEQAIRVTESRNKSAQGGKPRDDEYVEKIKQSFTWDGFSHTPSAIIIFDDVITTGLQFKAYKKLIRENLNNDPIIIGLFWAKAV